MYLSLIHIYVAAGRRKASLVLKGGTIVNVFTERTEIGDIAIEDGCIAGIGEYDGLVNVDMTGRYICPGFIDGHIHIESSMVSPPEFEKAVLPPVSYTHLLNSETFHWTEV